MKLKNETVVDCVDLDSGQIIRTTTQKTFSVKVEQDEFFMTYVKYLSAFYELKYADDIKILIKFCEICKFDTGEISLSTGLRKEIEQELNISTSSFSKSLKRLKDKGLVLGDKGLFSINPQLHWKGSNKTRAEVLKEKKVSVNLEFELK